MIKLGFITVELRPSVPLLFAFRDESRTWHSLWFSPGDVPTESVLHTRHRGPRRRKKRPKDRATWDSNYFSMSSYTRICLHDSNFKDCYLIKIWIWTFLHRDGRYFVTICIAETRTGKVMQINPLLACAELTLHVAEQRIERTITISSGCEPLPCAWATSSVRATWPE